MNNHTVGLYNIDRINTALAIVGDWQTYLTKTDVRWNFHVEILCIYAGATLGLIGKTGPI